MINATTVNAFQENNVPTVLPKHISLVCQDMNDSTEIGIVIGRLKKNKDVHSNILGIESKTTLQLGTVHLVSLWRKASWP